MVPLEVTHSVLVTKENLEKIAQLGTGASKPEEFVRIQAHNSTDHPHIEYEEIFARFDQMDVKASMETVSVNAGIASEDQQGLSSFSYCCTQLLTFFRSTYKSVFSFDSPPLHDPCAVFYVTNPEHFQTKEMFVDVELSSEKCLGRTLCDIHGISKKAPNITVCARLNVDAFWNKMINCLTIANCNSPLNKVQH
jgi:inosine-uridine nucleoside N-ribohydrolase